MYLPRIMLAASSSGSGKTVVTCGILQALLNRKMKVSSFKCGPDYIDPMFHSRIIGTQSKNIDTFFTNKETTKYLFKNMSVQTQISVIEGVMGYYDGLGGISDLASAYDVAKILEVPVILIINTKGMSISVAAIIKGIKEFRSDSNIKGVILNQMSSMLYNDIKEVIEKEVNVEVLGYVPKTESMSIKSRHLGLITPDEIKDLQKNIMEFATIIEECVNVDRIIELASQAADFNCNDIKIDKLNSKPVLAVAKDEAFCFYYKDNLELIEQMGASIKYFSPIRDKKLPDNINGLLLGGGYPELYTAQLSENKTMLSDIKDKLNAGLPILAECGGFMYLHESMENINGELYNMVGAISGKVYKTSKLSRFGYINLTTNKSNQILEEGVIRGHEFHYYESTNCGDSYCANKPLRKKMWKCIHGNEKSCIGFPHLYYYSNPQFIYNFLAKCNEIF